MGNQQQQCRSGATIEARDAKEELRQALTKYYRDGFPWEVEPTLADFRTTLKGRKLARVIEPAEELIGRLGAEFRLEDLRLVHFLD